MTYVHLNGEVVPAKEATVSVRDRGFMYGDAVFETLRVYNGTPFRWPEHHDRLARGCDALQIDHNLTRSELRERIDATIAANDFDEAYCKLSISRGPQPGTITPQPVDEPTVVVYLSELPRGGTTGESVWDTPATVAHSEVQAISDAALPSGIKTHNYLPNILARAEQPEADEVLMCDDDGYLLEGAASNLFAVIDGTLHTPDATLAVLPGITRDVVCELATDLEIPVQEGQYQPAKLQQATEAFLTNSIWEIRPIKHSDITTFETGPITTTLINRFNQLVEQQYY